MRTAIGEHYRGYVISYDPEATQDQWCGLPRVGPPIYAASHGFLTCMIDVAVGLEDGGIPPAKSTVQYVANDVMSGAAHYRAWVAIVNALDEVDPGWRSDYTKSPVSNAVAWIKSKGAK